VSVGSKDMKAHLRDGIIVETRSFPEFDDEDKAGINPERSSVAKLRQLAGHRRHFTA
jgi:hypothetical protein